MLNYRPDVFGVLNMGSHTFLDLDLLGELNHFYGFFDVQLDYLKVLNIN